MSNSLPGFFEGTEMPTAGWWEALWPNPVAVLIAVGLDSHMDVIDLCCGDGWFTLQIAKIARHVTAIDIDQPMLDLARVRLAESGVSNCAFVQGDAYEIAMLAGKPVDFVFLANAFHGVPDRQRLARAVAAALKPKGLFAIVNWHQRPREDTTVLGEPRGPRTELRVGPEATRTAVESAALAFKRIVEIGPYHYAAIFQKPEK
jgi:ubiquinone/menaquinone biosynthesis C-methylase UbiE